MHAAIAIIFSNQIVRVLHLHLAKFQVYSNLYYMLVIYMHHAYIAQQTGLRNIVRALSWIREIRA